MRFLKEALLAGTVIGSAALGVADRSKLGNGEPANYNTGGRVIIDTEINPQHGPKPMRPTISGNGAFSENAVTLTINSETQVSQKNQANITR